MAAGCGFGLVKHRNLYEKSIFECCQYAYDCLCEMVREDVVATTTLRNNDGVLFEQLFTGDMESEHQGAGRCQSKPYDPPPIIISNHM